MFLGSIVVLLVITIGWDDIGDFITALLIRPRITQFDHLSTIDYWSSTKLPLIVMSIILTCVFSARTVVAWRRIDGLLSHQESTA
jgi:hypothetical protein